MSPRELFEVLSRPGLSTAEKVTDVSGRGVGLDVVRDRIESVSGSIQLVNRPEGGTRFIIHLPLTLAIIEAVLMRYRGTNFAIPLGFVREIASKEECLMRKIEGRGTIVELRGQILPFMPLDSVLRFDEDGAGQWQHLVIAGTPDQRVAIPVDEMIGDHEVVMKTLAPMLGVSKFISGAAVLGDGRVVLILDVLSLFQL